MEDFKLLVDFHVAGLRQGPGGDSETKLAIALTGLKGRKDLYIADIGCGSGASTITLAKELDAKITAVDLFPDFLNILDRSSREIFKDDRIQSLVASMDGLPFAAESLDLIWSEGAIYNIGFSKGIQEWRQFLKPGGVLAVSEITWLTASRPTELHEHWNREYPEVATASEKIKLLEEAGYTLLGYFPLPSYCWMENYYKPMQARFADFIARHPNSKTEAMQIVENEKKEIELYERYKEYFSYGFYIAKKL